jgi:hypothetical protein
MKTAHLKALLAAAVLLLLLTLLPTVWAGGAPGHYQISVLTDLGWWDAGRLVHTQDLSEQFVGLPRVPLADPIRVRVTHRGDTAAHIDAIRLADQVPLAVEGAGEPQDLALKKLAVHDYDLIDAKGRTLEFTFSPDPAATYIALVARIEPVIISQIPFRFPLENTGQEMTDSSAFYAYELGSRPGALTLNGELADEQLGEPFFVEFCKPTTGHPATFNHGWVLDDGNYLYVAIDFSGDNTLDGEVDYSAVYLAGSSGLRRFGLSVPDQTWGVPGFTYTDAEVYQHKVYEYRIPFEQLRLTDHAHGDVVKLAFEAYGTTGADDENGRDPLRKPVGGQTVPFSVPLPRWLRPTLAIIAGATIVFTTTALLRRRRKRNS